MAQPEARARAPRRARRARIRPVAADGRKPENAVDRFNVFACASATVAKPDPKAEIGQLISSALEARSAGDLAVAERLYLNIVELDAAHHGALHNLGVIANLTGQLREAVQWYERALHARP